jgi:hypothetical protein
VSSSASPVIGIARPTQTKRDFNGGRIAVIVISSLVALAALACLAGGIAAVAVDRTARGADGFISTDTTRYSTLTYALVSDRYSGGTAGDWLTPSDVLGSIRLRAASSGSVFIGIGRAAAVERYLDNVLREEKSNLGAADVVGGSHSSRVLGTAAPRLRPAAAAVWAAAAAGPGQQTLQWTPRKGDWRVVVMNADAAKGVVANLSVAGRFPHLLAIGLGLLGGAIALFGLAGIGLYFGLRAPRGAAPA